MPTLRQLRSSSRRAKNDDGAPESEQSNKSPAKSSAKSNDEARGEESESAIDLCSTTSSKVETTGAAAAPKMQPPSTSTTISPSPYQVVSDLIDATCHEILLLEGEDSESIASYESYEVLSQRLNYYMGQLDAEIYDMEESEEDEGASGDDENEKPAALKDPAVRTRLLMAMMTIEVCAKSAYPEMFIDTSQTYPPGSNLPALIQSSASQWNEVQQQLQKLQGKVQNIGGGENTNPTEFESVSSQMQAMGALATLRSQLRAIVTEINEDEEDGKKRSPSDFNYLGDHLEEYKTASEEINAKLTDIHKTSHSDLFVPHQMLSGMKRCSTIERVKDSVTTLIDGIDEMIIKKVFPLRSFQVQFLKLLKGWEKSSLSPPALFKTGYFKHSSSESATAEDASSSVPSPSRATVPRGRGRVGAIKSPVRRTGYKQKKTSKKAPIPKDYDYDSSSSSDDEKLSRVVKKKTAKKAPPPKDYDYDDSSSDDEKLSRVVKRKPAAAKAEYKRGSPKLKVVQGKPKRYVYSDSEDSMMSDPPKVKSRAPPAKKAKRIPYSEAEKGSLLEGVERFGVGNWAEIREYYADVFNVNNRSNVNLKDLYRTLTK